MQNKASAHNLYVKKRTTKGVFGMSMTKKLFIDFKNLTIVYDGKGVKKSGWLKDVSCVIKSVGFDLHCVHFTRYLRRKEEKAGGAVEHTQDSSNSSQTKTNFLLCAFLFFQTSESEKTPEFIWKLCLESEKGYCQ